MVSALEYSLMEWLELTSGDEDDFEREVVSRLIAFNEGRGPHLSLT